MAEFVVIELNSPLMGLTHGVYRRGGSGKATALCYGANDAAVVAAALAAYTPVSIPEPARLPEPASALEAAAPKASKATGRGRGKRKV